MVEQNAIPNRSRLGSNQVVFDRSINMQKPPHLCEGFVAVTLSLLNLVLDSLPNVGGSSHKGFDVDIIGRLGLANIIPKRVTPVGA